MLLRVAQGVCEQSFLPKVALAQCPPHYWQLRGEESFPSSFILLEAALWLLHPGAQSLGKRADPDLGNDTWRAATASRAAPKCPKLFASSNIQVIISICTHQELDWIHKVPRLPKAANPSLSHPIFWATTNPAWLHCLHLSRGWENLLEGLGGNCFLPWNFIPSQIKNGSVSCYRRQSPQKHQTHCCQATVCLKESWQGFGVFFPNPTL